MSRTDPAQPTIRLSWSRTPEARQYRREHVQVIVDDVLSSDAEHFRIRRDAERVGRFGKRAVFDLAVGTKFFEFTHPRPCELAFELDAIGAGVVMHRDLQHGATRCIRGAALND